MMGRFGAMRRPDGGGEFGGVAVEERGGSRVWRDLDLQSDPMGIYSLLFQLFPTAQIKR